MVRDFILAALPWVLCGVALALLCGGLGKKGNSKNKKLDERLGLGAALGLLAGVALNSTDLCRDHTVVLALGPLWGMAMAVYWPESK